MDKQKSVIDFSRVTKKPKWKDMNFREPTKAFALFNKKFIPLCEVLQIF